MSHGVTTDVVKFQAYLGHGEQMEESVVQKLCEPHCWLEIQSVLSRLSERGWTCTGAEDEGDGALYYGKHKRLIAYPWVKGEYAVYCWNSSQYNNGGDLEGSVAADDRESIEAFLADFKDDLGVCEILEDDTAEQWG